MKRDFRPTVIALFTAASSVLLLAACASAPEEEAARPGGIQAAQPGTTTPGARPQPGAAKSGPAADLAAQRKDPASTLKAGTGAPSTRSVYFDYDRYDIRDEYRPLVETHARHLRANAQARVVIEGHGDERGSREYNIALGQRRADNVKQTLILLGGTDKQIESVSFGEEKPVCTQPAEGCWSQNRHADIRYTAEF